MLLQVGLKGAPEYGRRRPTMNLALVADAGAEVDLEMARRVEAHFPALSMLGYAAQSDIVAGTLRASDLILVWAENAARLPDGLPAELTGQRAAAFRGEEFGTRHDQASGPVGRFIAAADDLIGGSVSTTQMIFDVQTIIPGAMLAGHVGLTPAATDAHRMVLGAALALWAPGGIVHLGAKTATGYGEARLDGIGDHTADLAAWTGHIEAHAADILAIVSALAA